MRRRQGATIVLAAALLLVVPAWHSDAASSGDQMIAEAMRLDQKFVQLWNDRKWDELGVSIYAEDALAIPPNHEPIRGRVAIVEYWASVRDTYGEMAGGTETLRASASGNLVSLVGKYSFYTGRIRAVTHELFERQPDGSLKCTVDMPGLSDPTTM